MPESVKSEAKRLEDDPEAILKLIDLIFFYVDEKDLYKTIIDVFYEKVDNVG